MTFCLSLSVCPFVFVPFCLSACLPPCLCVCLPVSFPFLSLSQTCIRMRAHIRMLKKHCRFADGFRYGFGAEVGISTSMMPPRGPVGLEGLVTYRYFMTGNGHTVKDFSGDSPKMKFTHKDL